MSLHDKLPTGDNLPGEGINENSILEESKNPSKAGEYFSFSEEQRKVHEELLNNSKVTFVFYFFNYNTDIF